MTIRTALAIAALIPLLWAGAAQADPDWTLQAPLEGKPIKTITITKEPPPPPTVVVGFDEGGRLDKYKLRWSNIADQAAKWSHLGLLLDHRQGRRRRDAALQTLDAAGQATVGDGLPQVR